MLNKLFAASVVVDSSLSERQIRVVANSGKSDRVKDVLVARGCKLDDYRNNPIVLADHDPTKPVGNFEPEIKGDAVEGIITFAPAGLSAKADEYCGLYKAGVLKTVSVGFREIAAEPIKGGGILYREWELMELSCVAVPCDPSAVVTARSLTSAGPNWKCGASRNLPVAPAAAWDSAAAAERIFEKARFDGDDPDLSWARKGFLAYDAANPGLKSSYRGVFADVIDGRLTAVEGALATRAPAEDFVGLPEEVKSKGRAVLAEYGAKLKALAGAPAAKAIAIKSLHDVACLAGLLDELGWVHDAAVREAEWEQDASKVPTLLAGALRSLADAFLAMSAEETAELLAGRSGEPIPDDIAADDSLPDLTKRIRAAFRKAGRTLSAKNAERLEKAMDCMAKASDHLEEATEHVKTIHASGRAADNEEASDAPADGELGAEIEHRKRLAALFAAAP